MRKLGVVCLLSFALLVFAAVAFVRSDWTVYTDAFGPNRHMDSITIFRHYQSLHRTAFVFFGGLIVMGVLAHWITSIPFKSAFLIVPLAVYPPCFIISFARNLAPWTCFGQVQDDNGSEYYFAESSFLQGQTLALVRHERSDILFDEYKVLVTTNGDSPRRYLLIVRPDWARDGYGQVYLTPEQFVIGLRYENKMFMAYDLKGQRPLARDDVESLSPFLCLAKDTGLKEDDLPRVFDSWIGDEVGKPQPARIQESLHHENEKVRNFARKLSKKL